jgi:uncharacterized membrane protein YeaQ/YmgE (transglycosylase-associated protein family)
MGLSLTGIVTWCVFGLIVGAIARFLLPGRQSMGILVTIVLGIVGSFAGGTLATLIFGGSDSFVHASGWIMSIVGAMLLLFLYSRFAK